MTGSQAGSSVIRAWPILVVLIGAVITGGVAHFRVGQNSESLVIHKADQHAMTRDVISSIREGAARTEERVKAIQGDVERIQVEQRAGFERLERAIQQVKVR